MSPERRMGLGALADVVAPDRVIDLPVGEVSGWRTTLGARPARCFAVPGVHVDGHDFVADAVARGAIAAVVEREIAGLTVPQLIVDRTRRALADAADAWFDRPSSG